MYLPYILKRKSSVRIIYINRKGKRMKLITMILSTIGAITLLTVGIFTIKNSDMLSRFDSGAFNAYISMASKVLKTGDPAKGMILKKKMTIPEGMSKEEAIENAIELMDEVASEHGLAVVDHKVMPRKNGVYTQIRSYCSPTIADYFLNHSREFIGFMPCRIGIIEEPNGEIYLYTMNLELMIHGGIKLSPKLLPLAKEVERAMYGMLDVRAKGEE